jgi:hypothetical protein
VAGSKVLLALDLGSRVFLPKDLAPIRLQRAFWPGWSVGIVFPDDLYCAPMEGNYLQRGAKFFRCGMRGLEEIFGKGS